MHIPSLLKLNNQNINYAIKELFFSIINAKEDNVTDELKLITLKDIYSFPDLHFNSLEGNLRTQFFMSLQELSEKYPNHNSIIAANDFLQSFWNTTVKSIVSQNPNFSNFKQELNYLFYFSNYYSYAKEFESKAFFQVYEFYHFPIPEKIIHYQELYHIVKQLNNNYSLEFLDEFWINNGHHYESFSIDCNYFENDVLSSEISSFYYQHLKSLREAIAICLFNHFIDFPQVQCKLKSFPHFFQFCDWIETKTLHHLHLRYDENHLFYLHQLNNVEGYHYYINHFFGAFPQPSFNYLNYWEMMIKKSIDYDILLREVKEHAQYPLKQSFYSYLVYFYDELYQVIENKKSSYLEQEFFDPFSPFNDYEEEHQKALSSLKKILDNWKIIHLKFDLHYSLEHKDDQFQPKL